MGACTHSLSVLDARRIPSESYTCSTVFRFAHVRTVTQTPNHTHVREFKNKHRIFQRRNLSGLRRAETVVVSTAKYTNSGFIDLANENAHIKQVDSFKPAHANSLAHYGSKCLLFDENKNSTSGKLSSLKLMFCLLFFGVST